MKGASRFAVRITFIFLLVSVGLLSVKAGQRGLPSHTQIVLSISSRPAVDAAYADCLSNNLETELSDREFRVQVASPGVDFPTDEAAGSTVKITLTEASWKTSKALSVPYLLSRYRRVFELKSLVEISFDDTLAYCKSVNVGGSGPLQAQFLTDDKYDPDIVPDQSERISVEKETCRKLARKLARYLVAELK